MLTARQRLLAAVIKSCGGVDLRKFPDRLLLQKRLYLLDADGVDLGYVHRWYIRGPYSPALTRDAFAIDREERSVGDIHVMELPQVVSETIRSLKDALGTYWSDAKELELRASVVFLNRSTGEKSSERIAERLDRLKPGRYSQRSVAKALDFANGRGWLR